MWTISIYYGETGTGQCHCECIAMKIKGSQILISEYISLMNQQAHFHLDDQQALKLSMSKSGLIIPHRMDFIMGSRIFPVSNNPPRNLNIIPNAYQPTTTCPTMHQNPGLTDASSQGHDYSVHCANSRYFWHQTSWKQALQPMRCGTLRQILIGISFHSLTASCPCRQDLSHGVGKFKLGSSTQKWTLRARCYASARITGN